MYADYEYYKDHSNAYVSEDEFNTYSQRASDLLDYFTRRSLQDNLPTDEADLNQVKRACCELVDKIYLIGRRRAELSANAAGGGIIKSISSGGESLSFEAAAIDKAITGGEQEERRYLFGIVKFYLSMVADDKGRPYLYWGL